MTVTGKEGRDVCYGLIYLCVTGKRWGYAAFTLIVGHQISSASLASFKSFKVITSSIWFVFFHFQFNECFCIQNDHSALLVCLANNILQFHSPWNVGHQFLVHSYQGYFCYYN